MGFRDVRYAVCDRCGERIEVPAEPMASWEASERMPGWQRVDGERLLCPACSPAWETLLARQRVEREDYIAGR